MVSIMVLMAVTAMTQGCWRQVVAHRAGLTALGSTIAGLALVRLCWQYLSASWRPLEVMAAIVFVSTIVVNQRLAGLEDPQRV